MKMGIQTLFDKCFNWMFSLVESILVFIQDGILEILKILLVIGVLVWSAVFLYASFYVSYMPEVLHERDVNFFFKSDCTQGELCSFPSANVTLIKEGKPQLLKRGQIYQAVIELQMPESATNRNLGMFMITADFYAKGGQVMLTTSRATMLHYRSRLLHILDTVMFSPFYLLGSREQKQTLTVPLHNRFQDDPYHPIVGTYIEIRSKKIEIYSATIRIKAVFEGLRYWLYHWPVSSAVGGIILNLLCLFAIILISWHRLSGSASPAYTGPLTLDGEPLSLDDTPTQAEDGSHVKSSTSQNAESVQAEVENIPAELVEQAEPIPDEADIVLLGPDDVHGEDQGLLRRRGPPRV